MKKPVPPPRSCFIEVTTRCNLKCRICGQTLYPGPKEDMSIETFDKLEPIFSRTEEVMLYGSGEPLLNPHYFQMLKRVKSYGNCVHIITNGTLLDEITCRELVTQEVDFIRVSIDGATADTFNYIRKGADFTAIIANVRRLLETRNSLGREKPRISINFVVTQLNLPELPDIVRLAHSLKLDGICVVELIGWDLIKDEKLKSPRNELHYFERAINLAENLKVLLDIQPGLLTSIKRSGKGALRQGLTTAAQNGPRRKMCRLPWTTPQIDFNGNVRPCCWPSRVLGNVHDDSFAAIWNGTAYAEFRRKMMSAHPPEECATCTAVPWSDPIPTTLDMEKVISGQLGEGWYDKELSPQGLSYRWMGKRASFHIHNPGGRELRLKLFSNRASFRRVLPVDILINGDFIQQMRIKKGIIHEVSIRLPRTAPGLMEVTLRAEETFVPARCAPGSNDGRELSLALCSAATA